MYAERNSQQALNESDLKNTKIFFRDGRKSEDICCLQLVADFGVTC